MEDLGQLCALFTFVFLLSSSLTAGEVTQNEDGSGKISFQPPTLNDEEAHSMHIPDGMKCDACKAIAYQLTDKLEKAQSKRKSLKRLPESEYYKLIEDTCDTEGEELKNYGLKEVAGEKRLSGPGLEAEEVAGVMQGGGRWPDRMQRLCNLYVEDFDEEAIYEAFLDDSTSIRQLLCENRELPGHSDACLPQKQVGKKKQKKKKGKEEL